MMIRRKKKKKNKAMKTILCPLSLGKMDTVFIILIKFTNLAWDQMTTILERADLVRTIQTRSLKQEMSIKKIIVLILILWNTS